MLYRYSRFHYFFLLVIFVISGCFFVQAQESDQAKDQKSPAQATDQKAPAATTSTQSQSGTQAQQDPLKRPRSKDEKAANIEKLGGVYKKWLDEDVRWIITDEELSAFKKLTTNAERDQFIEAFWQRRDPTPDTAENEYKEEHYRRIAYADEHFAAGIPGRKTDRGRIYIMYGPPTSIDSHPMGGPYQRPEEEGGGQTETYPFEVWRYRYLEGIGQEVEIEFVDETGSGSYEMTLDRSKKDALLHVPNAGLTEMESMGLASKADRFNGGLENLGAGFFNQNNQTKQFDRLETFAKLNRAPGIKYNDLQNEIVTHRFRTNLLPFDVQVDFVKLDPETVLVPVTLQVPLRNLVFTNKDGVQRAVINVYGQLTKLNGQIVQTFEDTLHKDIPAELLEKELNNVSLYWKALPMKPGLYRLDVVVKDVNGDKTGVFSKSYTVPNYNDEKLSSSSLILADRMEAVPSREVGTGSFVIGTNKVVPKVQPADGKPAAFDKKQKDRVNFWMQVYNLGLDQKTNKPSATVEYQIVNTTTNKPVVDFTETTAQMGNIGEQVTLAKSLPLSQLDPGVYQVTIKVNDQVSRQTISPTAKFVVQ
ncbi:MAG TPA: GWxTD domain-containing protein [Candidatus Angelobacter sp.]|nr:GWxTD domain-containing protein [Candidatus Angelobacter sp.]